MYFFICAFFIHYFPISLKMSILNFLAKRKSVVERNEEEDVVEVAAHAEQFVQDRFDEFFLLKVFFSFSVQASVQKDEEEFTLADVV